MRSRPSHLDADNDTSFQLSQKTLFSYLLCLPDKSEMSRVFSGIFKGFKVSELSTKAANRLLLFRYLHKNWTQQVFLRSTLRKLTFEKPVRPVFS